MKTVEELEERLSRPGDALISFIKKLEGDILILGCAGKMGPSLAKLARRAVEASGQSKNIIGVSRYSNAAAEEDLKKEGIITIAGDLLDEKFLESLPEVPNVIYMAGMKFGTSGNEHFTWAMNAYLPGKVALKFRKSRIVVFSTGNVYPLVEVESGGATEKTLTGPVGEYAQSCLGRERIFEYFSHVYKTPAVMYRLNYAIDLRYGVLLDIAKSVYEGRPIDLSTGYANVIWQGDANDIAIRSLGICATPPTLLNVTGAERVSMKWLAEEFGKLMDKRPEFVGQIQPTALLSNASKARELFGTPAVSLEQMINWTAEWVAAGGQELGKPTHFQVRDGKF